MEETNMQITKQDWISQDLRNNDLLELDNDNFDEEALEVSIVEQNTWELSTSQEKVLSPREVNKLTRQLRLEEIKWVMNEMWLDEKFIFWIAKETAMFAEKANPKTWELMPDYDVRLKAVNFMAKARKIIDKEPTVIVPLFSQYNWKW